MEFSQNERILVLGGRKGLGQSLLQEFHKLQIEAVSISRKSEWKADFSKAEQWPTLLADIRQWQPHRIFLCAAGGPYGNFSKFSFRDHQWAWRVSFEFPAALLHEFLRQPLVGLKQIGVMGSAIAEEKPDPGAASYCASKHALKGLVTTLQGEELPFDLRLLSPGYMMTDLLPPNSAPRLEGRARSTQDIARQMIRSISDPALRMRHQSFD